MPSQRIGFATGYDPSLTVRDMVDLTIEAEGLGYELVFFSETIALMRDSVTAMSAFGISTTKIGLGCTQIVGLRSPVVMAQTLMSLDELTGGRMILAPGACTKSHAKRHGLEEANPAEMLVDWVEAIRHLLQGRPGRFSGELISLEDCTISWKPVRSRVPLWIAATSTKGLRLAGRLGDGVVLNAIASPDYSANAIRIVREAVERAGKDWSRFEVAQLINCSMEDDKDAAYEEVRWEVASKFDPFQLPFNARPRIRVGEPYIREEDLSRFENAYREGGKRRLMDAIPQSYLEGLTASGTHDDVLDKVQKYRGAGVKLPIIRPAAKRQTARIMKALAPT